MKISIFNRLKVIEEEKDMNRLNVGECFLYGKNVLNQKENIQINKPISYYKIINKNNGGIEYMPIYDYLEKD